MSSRRYSSAWFVCWVYLILSASGSARAQSLVARPVDTFSTSSRLDLEVVSTAEQTASGLVVLRLTGSKDRTYTVERSADLIRWSPVDEIKLTSTGRDIEDRIGDQSSGEVFYRAKALDQVSPYVPGEILVRTRASRREAVDAEAERLLNESGVEVTPVFVLDTPIMRLFGEVEVTCHLTDRPVDEVVMELNQSNAFDLVCPNHWLYPEELPNDPEAIRQWGVTSSSPFGANAEGAWDRGWTGDREVVVGIIDTGVQVEHPDLKANIWVNSREIPGNFIDDDANGFVDDVNGYDFFNQDATLFDGPYYDLHGTHVAGIIGAAGGNGEGVAGINWNISIVSAKALGETADGIRGKETDIVKAIDYMTSLKLNGVNLVAVNCSWGGTPYSPLLHDAMIRAAKADILMVCSAGNEGIDTDPEANRHYPSTFDTTVAPEGGNETPASYDAIVSVAAIQRDGALLKLQADATKKRSNYGKTTVDIAAPGWEILSTATLDGNVVAPYAELSGTSMAAPHVTGALALFASEMNLSASQLKSRLLETAKPVDKLRDQVATSGTLDVEQFITGQLPRENAAPTANEDDLEYDPVQGGPQSVAVLDNDSDADGDALALTGFSQGRYGTVSPAVDPPGSLVYTAGDAFTSSDVFSYIVEDTQGGSAIGRVKVKASAIPNARPEPRDDAVEIFIGDRPLIAVTHNDYDPEGEPLHIVDFSQGANRGSVSLLSPDTAVLEYSPVSGFVGDDFFTYKVSDPAGNVAEAKVTVTVRQKTERTLTVGGDTNFGVVNVGDESVRVLTLTNSGNATLTIDSLAYPPGFSGSWRGGNISKGSSQFVVVFYRPVTAGLTSGELTLQGNFTRAHPVVLFTGEGAVQEAEDLKLEGELDFGQVSIATSEFLPMTIANEGASDVNVASVELPAGYSANWTGGDLPAGALKTFHVTFSPKTVGVASGDITLRTERVAC